MSSMSKPVQNEVSSQIKELRLHSIGMLWQRNCSMSISSCVTISHYGLWILHVAKGVFELLLLRKVGSKQDTELGLRWPGLCAQSFKAMLCDTRPLILSPSHQICDGKFSITSICSAELLTSSNTWFHRNNRLLLFPIREGQFSTTWIVREKRLWKLHRSSTGWITSWAAWGGEGTKLPHEQIKISSQMRRQWVQSIQYKAVC